MLKKFTIVTIKQGQITNMSALTKLLWEFIDGRYILEISASNKRTNPQNRYYWGLVIPMIQKGIKDLGTDITKEECHEFLKARFNSEEIVNEETGEVITLPRSTTGLNKEQFSEYIGKIQQFAAEFLGIVIPDAGVQTTIDY